MSSFICNDITTEAVASGFYRAGYCGSCEVADIADALRALNEAETGYGYTEDCAHIAPEVTGRDFTTAEMVGAARCMRYQCDEGAGLDGMRSHGYKLADISALLDGLPDELLRLAVARGEYETGKYFDETIYLQRGQAVIGRGGREVYLMEPVEFPWELDE